MTYVISVGGSLIVPPKGIDINFLKSFRHFVLKRYDVGDKLIIVTGGGSVARKYVAASQELDKAPEEEQDWLGIHATRLNAHLIKTLLRDVAHLEIVTNPDKVLKIKSRVIIAGGYRPGCSTDYVAVLLAKKYKAKLVINLSNIDYVYKQDPVKFKQAKAIKQISWHDFRELIDEKWKPGMNVPFDPIASVMAANMNLKVVVMSGRDLNNVVKFMDNKKYKGTLISN